MRQLSRLLAVTGLTRRCTSISKRAASSCIALHVQAAVPGRIRRAGLLFSFYKTTGTERYIGWYCTLTVCRYPTRTKPHLQKRAPDGKYTGPVERDKGKQ
ncbi:hypothetical protein CI102_12714 [Trichoderma harzianum]|nr:hypothetical protein CI102_12714 [Trichoderma harzianum]